MKENRQEFRLRSLLRVLKLSRSGFYRWLKFLVSKRKQADKRLATKIKEIFKASRRRYGSPRVHAELKFQGERISRKRVTRLMKELGLVSICHKRRFKSTTNSRHRLPTRLNLLQRDFSAEGPNQKWVGDITYIRTARGWLYLASVIDLFSKQIVGWTVSSRIDTELVESAFLKAFWSRKPSPGLL